AKHQLAGVATHRGLGKAGQLAIGNGGHGLHFFGEAAEARTQDHGDPWLEAWRLFGDSFDHALPSTCGPNDIGRSWPSVTVRCTPSGPQRWILRSSDANSRSFWRQPPHGVTTSGPGPITAHSTTRCLPAATRAAMAVASAQR